MRNKIFVAAAAAAIMALFTGCGPSENESSVPVESITESTIESTTESTVESAVESTAESDVSDTDSETSSSSEESSSVESEPNSEETSISEPTTTPTEPSDNPGTSSSTPTQPEWTEEAMAQATMYVNTPGISSRAKAIAGATIVKSYNLNDSVTVVAKTSTLYYKLADGSYIHRDYLQANKVVQQTEPETPATPSNQYTGLTPTDTTGMQLDANGFPINPSDGQRFVDKTGQMWQWVPGYFEWAKLGAPAEVGISTGEHTEEEWNNQVGF